MLMGGDVAADGGMTADVDTVLLVKHFDSLPDTFVGF
jgi:hypothetical protein